MLVGPAMSRSQPASVGLKVSLKIVPSTSRFEALCSCRLWSWESMNSLPFHVSEWIAPATRNVVVITISEPPAGLRITASLGGGCGREASSATAKQTGTAAHKTVAVTERGRRTVTHAIHKVWHERGRRSCRSLCDRRCDHRPGEIPVSPTAVAGLSSPEGSSGLPGL